MIGQQEKQKPYAIKVMKGFQAVTNNKMTEYQPTIPEKVKKGEKPKPVKPLILKVPSEVDFDTATKVIQAKRAEVYKGPSIQEE